MASSLKVVAAAVFSTIFLLARNAEAIKCYQCSGTDPSQALFQCNEWLESDIDIEPDSCDGVYGAKYCVKHVGRFEGGIGTKRFCSALDLGNYCNYVRQPGDTLDNYRTCIFTCTGDGCNSSAHLKPIVLTLLTLTTFVFVLR